MSRHYESTRIIRHSCGHNETHTILYRHAGEISAQTFNLAQSRCYDCTMEIVKLEQELKLPPLRGSSRMVNWAANLRINLAKGLRKYGASDAIEALKRITEAKWFIDHREQKLQSIIGMLTQS
jgi:hypothetical protein